MKTPKSVLLNYVGSALIIMGMSCIIGITILTAWWTFWQPPPFEWISAKALDTQVIRGERLRVRVQGRNVIHCRIIREFTYIKDSRGIVHRILSSWEENGANTEIDETVKIAIPLSASIGAAELWSVTVFSCNPIREHTVRSPFVKFEIVAKNG